jgi:hypothetical protein
MAAYDTGKGPFEQIGDNGKAALPRKQFDSSAV